jgi:hypothetical protein
MRDMRRIGDWFVARKTAKNSAPKFFLVATHCDLIPEYDILSINNKNEFTDKFWRAPLIQKLINLGGGVKTSDAQQEALTTRLIENVLLVIFYGRQCNGTNNLLQGAGA